MSLGNSSHAADQRRKISFTPQSSTDFFNSAQITQCLRETRTTDLLCFLKSFYIPVSFRVQKISAKVLVTDRLTQCHRWDRVKHRLRSILYLALMGQCTCGKDVNPGCFATALHATQKGIGQQGTKRMASNCCQKVGKLWNKEKFGVFGFTPADGKVN